MLMVVTQAMSHQQTIEVDMIRKAKSMENTKSLEALRTWISVLFAV